MHRPTLSRALLVSLRHSSSSSSSSQIHPAYPARDRLDPSTVELLDDQTLGTRERRRRRRASDLERRSEDRSASETLGSPQKVNGDIERDTQDWDAISEGFSQSPQTTAGPSRAFSVSHAENVDVEESEYFAPRDERRSPASVFGSKRIGSVVLPGQLIDGIQKQIDGKPSMVKNIAHPSFLMLFLFDHHHYIMPSQQKQTLATFDKPISPFCRTRTPQPPHLLRTKLSVPPVSTLKHRLWLWRKQQLFCRDSTLS